MAMRYDDFVVVMIFTIVYAIAIECAFHLHVPDTAMPVLVVPLLANRCAQRVLVWPVGRFSFARKILSCLVLSWRLHVVAD